MSDHICERGGRALVPDPHPSGRTEQGYRLRIVYTEPEFQSRNPDTPPSFSIEYDCPEASSPQDAIRMGLREWDRCAKYSRVGWRRVIQSVTVVPWPDGSA